LRKILIILFLLFIITIPVNALTPSQHMAVANIITQEDNSPLTAFTKGFISHAITDMLEPRQYHFDIFNPEKKDYKIILAEGLLMGFQLYYFRDSSAHKYAMIGALAPDIIDGLLSLIDRDRYLKGNHLFFWHRPYNFEIMTKKETIETSVVLTGLTILF